MPARYKWKYKTTIDTPTTPTYTQTAMSLYHQDFRWNLPNAITLARFAIVPVFLAFLLVKAPWATLVALVVFVAASISDAVDGYVARRTDQITTFGKFADPLADKLLMTAAWLAFVETGQLGAAVVMVLIGRDFIVTGLRILAVAQGMVLSAGALGKLKTGVHIALVVVVLVGGYWGWPPSLDGVKQVLVWLSLLTSVVSGAHYFYLCRTLFQPG